MINWFYTGGASAPQANLKKYLSMQLRDIIWYDYLWCERILSDEYKINEHYTLSHTEQLFENQK